MKTVDLIGQRVLVAGLGLTGRSVMRWLQRHDVGFEVMDARATAKDLPAGTALHADLDAALSRPFDVIVLSPGIARANAAIDKALAAGTRVIGDIELFASAVDAPVVAVTGSNGKSTVVAWLSEALCGIGVRAVPCGNIGDAALDAIDDDVELYVLELSSYQLESTDSLAPLAASVLNVSEDHLDRYDGFAAYAAVKRRIYAGAENTVVNAQDAHTWPDAAGRSAAIHIDAGPVSDVRSGSGAARWHLGQCAVRSARAVGTTDAWLCRDGRALLDASALALPGRHNRFNALAVLALASVALGRLRDSEALPAALLDAVARFAGLPHRTELVARIAQVRWYDDSKGTNVDACVQAIEAMPGPVVLIAGGLGKGADFTPIAERADRLRAAVLIGRDAAKLAAVMPPGVPVHHADTLARAVDTAASLAVPGDAVLLSPACASFDMFDDFAARGRAFQLAVHGLQDGRVPTGACR